MLRLDVLADVVRLEVQDDGHGVGTDASSRGSGLGLSSMRMRAEELGGTWSLTSSGTGTTVHVGLPR